MPSLVGLGASPVSPGRGIGASSGKKAGSAFKEYSVAKFSEGGFGEVGAGKGGGWEAPAWAFAKLATKGSGEGASKGVVSSAVHVTSWAGASFEVNNCSDIASLGTTKFTGPACAAQLSALPTPWPQSFDDKTAALSAKAVIFISRLDEKTKSEMTTSDARAPGAASADDAKAAFAALFLDPSGERRRVLVDAGTGEWATATVSDSAPTAPAFFFNSDFSPYVLLDLDKSARTKAGKAELKRVIAPWASLVEPGIVVDNDAAAVRPVFKNDGSDNVLPITPPPAPAKAGAAPGLGVPPPSGWAAMSVMWQNSDTLFVGMVGAFSPTKGYKIATPQKPQHLEHSLRKNAWLRPHAFAKEHPKEQRKGFTTAIPIGLFDGPDASIPFPLPDGTHILLDNPNSSSADFEVLKTTYLPAERQYKIESLSASKKDSPSLNALQVVHTPAALRHYLTYGHVNFFSTYKLVFRDASQASVELKSTADGGVRDLGKFLIGGDAEEEEVSDDDDDDEGSDDGVPALLPLRSGVGSASSEAAAAAAAAAAAKTTSAKKGKKDVKASSSKSGKEPAPASPPAASPGGGAARARGDGDDEPSLVPISSVRAPAVKKAPKRPDLTASSFAPFLEQLEKQAAWAAVGSGAERELWTTLRTFTASAARAKFTPTASPEAQPAQSAQSAQEKQSAVARPSTRAGARPSVRAQSATRLIARCAMDRAAAPAASAESPPILSVFDELRLVGDGKQARETESDVYRPVFEVRANRCVL
jgi:hypothetical protein